MCKCICSYKICKKRKTKQVFFCGVIIILIVLVISFLPYRSDDNEEETNQDSMVIHDPMVNLFQDPIAFRDPLIIPAQHQPIP